ncbi:MAG: ABC transporter substrate-binding protein [Deltaproteobacteria bacterium]|nr:ABC transporter substrate-binding protein [Deltaproteobacteria bacterium]
MTGRTIHLDGPPGRALLLTPIAWHYLAVTGSDASILMIPPYMKREFKASGLDRIFPHMASKPLSFLDNASIAPFSTEQSLWVRPDVIFSWDYLAWSFERVKFPGLIRISPDGGDKSRLFRVLGDAGGHSGRVTWLWARYQEELDTFYSQLPEELEEKTLVILANTGFTLWNGSTNPHFHKILKKLKAVNAAEKKSFRSGKFNATALLNIETLLQMDPEIIYINPYALAFTYTSVADIYNNPKLQGLKAVKNRRVYHMPSGMARLEGPVEEPLLVMWLFQTLRPELAPHVDLRKKILEAFMVMYGYSISKEEIDAWLRLEENSLSHGYARFYAHEVQRP